MINTYNPTKNNPKSMIIKKSDITKNQFELLEQHSKKFKWVLSKSNNYIIGIINLDFNDTDILKFCFDHHIEAKFFYNEFGAEDFLDYISEDYDKKDIDNFLVYFKEENKK